MYLKDYEFSQSFDLAKILQILKFDRLFELTSTHDFSYETYQDKWGVCVVVNKT